MKSPKTGTSIPDRFRVTRGTLLFDKFMNYFIVVGGIAVIGAVMGIFVFIFFQTLPLFKGASVEEMESIPLKDLPEAVLAVDMDEWSELPVVIDQEGNLTYVDIKHGGATQVLKPDFGTREISSLSYNGLKKLLVAGSMDGGFAYAKLSYTASFEDGSERRVVPSVETSPWYSFDDMDASVRLVDFSDNGSEKLAVGVLETAEGQQHVAAVTLAQKKSLFGAGKISVSDHFDLSDQVNDRVVKLLVSETASIIACVTDKDEVLVFVHERNSLDLRQRFKPFEDLDDSAIQTVDFLQGGVSLVFTNAAGENRIFSLYHQEATNQRMFGLTKNLKAMPQAVHDYFPGMRNKSFLLVADQVASLRFATTENIRWQQEMPFSITHGVISEKYDRIALLDREHNLHLFKLDDPHPEAGFKAFFGKVWYEGQSEPKYIWQSTGGSDDFEPKLSLIPVIIGSLKGTFYALIFAVPIALLAALYTSQFLQPELKRFIKPTMEIMASLPSVVLGFMAALWLAPIIDPHLPSFFLVVLGIPLTAMLVGYVWQSLPKKVRLRLPLGLEFVLVIPFILVSTFVLWKLGPLLESWLFVVENPDTGARVADFRLWWPHFTGADYTQRNSLVVGFMMGFAVIPIIFTIAEDAMSNVPTALRSGSLALGASRWQTAINIVLPTASAGIFSSLMIGFGRAVGETMIVVMATGNTPVMDLNIFSGMRTLSANIAVELPEAPHHGTLYRTLFLGALVLFIMTFVVNTLAEVMRQKLRERYKTVE